jgi:hypothetical protein
MVDAVLRLGGYAIFNPSFIVKLPANL